MRLTIRQIIPRLAFAFLLLAGTAHPGFCALFPGENHALIIGIGQYENWTALTSPPLEARALAGILTTQYDFKAENVVLLTDDAETTPTRDSISLILEGYAQNLSAQDNLLIFFSGRSQTDDQGETYWIPLDAKNQTTLNWLRHSDLVNEYFGSPDFKVKNLLILTDSPFSPGLMESRPNPLSVMNLRYGERIRRKSARPGREVIASGKPHEDPDEDGALSLFARRITHALENNTLEIVDLENLLFAPNGIGAPGAPAEPWWVRGRVRGQVDQGGQFVIMDARLFPTVNVSTAGVEPAEGYPGDAFLFRAETSDPARSVILNLDGETFPMEGQDSSWTHEAVLEDLGEHAFSIQAVNELGRPGEEGSGVVLVIKRPAPLIAVEAVQASPAEVLPGEEVLVTITTQAPAQAVGLTVDGQALAAEGGGTSWFARVKAGEAGVRDFSARAVNEDQQPGPPAMGSFTVRSALVSVVDLTRMPASGDVGQAFVIEARTDKAARVVRLDVNGRERAMEGSETRWSYRFVPDRAGTYNLVVAAENQAGEKGPSRQSSLVATQPQVLPDVVQVWVEPSKVYSDTPFTLHARTSAQASRVILEMKGDTKDMAGSGTQWKHTAEIGDTGRVAFTVRAEDSEKKQGKSQSGFVAVEERPLEKVELSSARVNPKKVSTGEPAHFIATTNRPAKAVYLEIGDERISMDSDNRTIWNVKKAFEELGTVPYAVVAESRDGVLSERVEGALLVKAALVEIVESFLEPDVIYAGGELIVIALTDRPAAGVDVRINDETSPMNGSGLEWRYETRVPVDGPGTLTIFIRAKNAEGVYGAPKIWDISK